MNYALIFYSSDYKQKGTCKHIFCPCKNLHCIDLSGVSWLTYKDVFVVSDYMDCSETDESGKYSVVFIFSVVICNLGTYYSF